MTTTTFLIVAQMGLMLAGAPLLAGIVRSAKARFQMRRGPSIWQPYRDLSKWWGKETVESDQSTSLSRLAPPIVLGATVLACLMVPLLMVRAPLPGWSDVLVVIGLLALGRFVLVLAAMDSASSFGAMGASREVAIAGLVEPGLILAVVGSAVAVGSTDLGLMAAQGEALGLALLTPAHLLAAAAFIIVAVVETGHEPFDNPDTHLELTMIHEGMLLETSGRRLAMLMYAAQLKLLLVVALFAAAFLPYGAASEASPATLLVGVLAAVVKAITAALILATLDAALAKARILALPGLIGLASLLALVGLAARLWDASMSLAQTANALDSVAFIAVVLSVALVVTRSLNRMVWLVALQAIVVSLAPLLIGVALGEAHLIVAAALSVAIRGVAIPLALGSVVRRSNVRVELHPYLGPRASAIIAIVIVLFAAPAAESLTTSSAVASAPLLAAAIAVTSIGLLLIITRRKTLSAVVGLLVFDTGLSLAAFGLSFGMPLVVELGVLFDLLIAVAVVVAVSRRMLTDIGSLSTDNLRNLRG